MSEEINVLALVKGEERYVFLFNDDNRAETLRSLGRYASNPDLSFTWYDAAVLSQKIRQQLPEQHQAGKNSAVKPRFTFPISGSIDITSVDVDQLDFDEFS
ncbi:MAG: hypothetical protein COA78_14430 [Blastopirellula sp.]|nr:MAG: hypothetical protein COA78_14430 [Blastopirellula sp.]